MICRIALGIFVLVTFASTALAVDVSRSDLTVNRATHANSRSSRASSEEEYRACIGIDDRSYRER